MIFGLIEAIRWESSDILLRMPFILIWRILKSLLREVGGLGVVSESEEVEEFEGEDWEGDEGGDEREGDVGREGVEGEEWDVEEDEGALSGGEWVEFGESGEFWLSLSVDEVVGVVGVVGLSLSESWLLSLCLVQMKEGL